MLSNRRSKAAVNDVLLTLSLTWAGAAGIFTSKRGARFIDVFYNLLLLAVQICIRRYSRNPLI